MKAIVQNGYGSPAVLSIREVEKPAIKEDQVLVRVHAAAINAGDYFTMRGSPWLVRFMVGFPRPRDYILGWDMAGRAAGGVGTFAVQIAKALGAEVVGVCSAAKVEMVRAIGADYVVDYTREDFTSNGRRYDLILDNVGNRAFSDLRRALKPQGRIIPNSGHGGMRYVLKGFLLAPFMSQQSKPLTVTVNGPNLAALVALIEAGKVTPVIDRAYPFDDILSALDYAAQGRARGKVVISVAPDGVAEGDA